MADCAQLEWLVPLVRGQLALQVCALVFLAARHRWKEREDARGPADVGLD